ncbi:MAG: DNA mismatch repair protein MutS [Capsulimonadales bacterium]|nr:DNA mismatch repair protein MutS [Capsulimonadales bacterium]
MPSVPLEKLTPMLRQYVQMKEERPDVLLLMRVGDFFEAYGDDAELIARELNITLTGREIQGMAERYPMAGVPHHALERYLARLVKRGHKVAVCDQVEDPKQAKGLVKRQVTRVVTPGTLVEDALLDARSNNYLVAAVLGSPGPRLLCGVGVIDVSTGEFLVTELTEGAHLGRVLEEINRLNPSECLVPEDMEDLAEAIRGACPATLTRIGRRDLPRSAYDFLLDHFGTATLRGFGCDDYTAGLDAAAALLVYVKSTHMSAVPHIRTLATYSAGDGMALDAPTRRNLELTQGIYDHARGKSLLAVLDQTLTSMGGRLLKKWLDSPLLSVERIERRLDAVEAFFEDPIVRGDVRDTLRVVADLERLIARISTGTANARDLVALRLSLLQVPEVAERAATIDNEAIRSLCVELDPLTEVTDLIGRAIAAEPPLSVREGGLIRDGYDAELDELRGLSRGGKSWIAEREMQERERTGIKSLKVGFNSVFGYYIEVTRANLSLVPKDYIRKQTTAQGERYITPDLKEMEARILGAEEKSTAREYDLFCGVRDAVAALAPAVLQVAQAIARIDVVAALAEVAATNRYVRPVVDTGSVLEIKAGRHPVVEKLAEGAVFIPNDTLLDDGPNQVHVITGPNSSGKSTVLRQVALITLLAQVGSFVPADAARIGIVDRIFTRVGAHDDLAAGQSTFMVEMTETANILNNATERSLVILDEIGRGTSTFDGVSIAWAVAEFLAGRGCKTLFATHYHLLNDLEKSHPNVRNFRIAVKETNDRIIWLRKIVAGGTDKSYGIQVARMAGLPPEVVARAGEILTDLERNDRAKRDLARHASVSARTQKMQMTLFEAEPHPVLERLKTLDLTVLSPIEALNLLYGMQREIKEK